MNKIIRFLLLVAGIQLLSMQLQAQSMKIFGNSSSALECYESASLAIQFESASFSDLESCDRAIAYESLKQADRIATYVNRGIIYVGMGKPERAVRDYERALAMKDDIAEVYLNRGNLWFMAARFQEAISDYDKAQELQIRQEHILFLNRGMAYENMGLLDQAEENYLASLNVVPEWKPAVEKLERVGRKRSELETDS